MLSVQDFAVTGCGGGVLELWEKSGKAGGMRQGAGASVQQVRLLLAFLMWLQYI